MKQVVVGLDLGTQGCRAVAVDSHGILTAFADEHFLPVANELPEGWHEQTPTAWWEAVCVCLRRITGELGSRSAIVAIAVDSTSGTIVPIGGNNSPLHPAIMYNDTRSQAYVAEVRHAGADLESRLGYSFGTSFALPKIVWLARTHPELLVGNVRFVHAADYLVGCLTGDFSVSDYSNALKTGYDLILGCWPKFIEEELGIPLTMLPRVVASGTQVGRVRTQAAAECGLPQGTPVYAGATDGTSAQIASGSIEPGDWNAPLGTTLALKGLSRNLLIDPQRRIYSHRHPSGLWMPSGASNTGGEWIAFQHHSDNLAQLDQEAATRIPTMILRYPLARPGERFPFNTSSARGFTLGVAVDPVEGFAAGLEGVALLERLAFETMAQIGASVAGRTYVTGGGARSQVWLRIRASALARQLLRPAISDAAMGAALLAGAAVWYADLAAACRSMVRVDLSIDPEPRLQTAYAEKYGWFLRELRKRDYLQPGTPSV